MNYRFTNVRKAFAMALLSVALGVGTTARAQKVTIDIPAPEGSTENIPLSALDISKTTYGWGTPKANRSIDGNPITINDTVYSSGVGTHGPSKIIVKINGTTTDFYATLGIDDEIKSDVHGEFDYNVYTRDEKGNTKTVATGTISCKKGGTRSVKIHADVNGWKYLFLETTNGSDGEGNWNDHVDWANAYFVFQEQNSNPPVIVSEEETSSKLGCASTVFSQPGVRFMQKVRCANPGATVTVTDLPEGLSWNADRQIVVGTINETGVYHYTANIMADGETNSETITLTVSDSLQLPVPFMGWLSWNSVQGDISEKIVRQAVDLFKEKGLFDAGWNTIMMDDLWHASSRAADGSPRPNADRFPNGIEPVSKYVHDNGMKFGLYTDAAAKTCAGAYGSYGYETIDAQTYAKWGIDIVKEDYCNAPSDVETCKARYKAQADAFKAAGYGTRLYICEWGVREPWKWGAEVGGVCWRVTQDVRDCWTGKNTGEGVVQSIRDLKNLSAWAGVNRFNDADMLCTGLHATGKSSNDLCDSGPGMTQDEYRTQFALWCMWSSPMALSFDPRRGTLTADDYKILTNREMIAINQDPMGQQADLVSETDDLVVFAKDCENGDIVVSVTNMSGSTKTASIDLSTVGGLHGDSTYTCRDVWNQRSLDDVTGVLETRVNKHATRVFRLARKSTPTGVSNVKTEEAAVSIVPGKNAVTVNTEGDSRVVKRILVSDLSGRIAATTTSDKASTTVSLPSGTYVVTVVCDAKATTAKVVL